MLINEFNITDLLKKVINFSIMNNRNFLSLSNSFYNYYVKHHKIKKMFFLTF